MSTKTLIGILLAGTTGLLIFLFVHLSSDPSKISIGSKTASACTGSGDECLPVVTFTDTTGKAHTPESMHGKVVIVNFWATWCGPCKREIPDLSKLYTKYKDKGVVMLGVLTNDASKTQDDLLNFASDFDMTFPIVRENSDILTSFGYPNALPTTFVFGKDGHRIGQKRLGAIDINDLDATLSQLTN